MHGVLAVVVLAGASVLWQTVRLGIGPVPTSPRVRRAVLALVPPTLEGEVHELGAGWGGLALGLARRCPRAHVIAWECSPVPYLVLCARQRLGRVPNLEVRCADFFGASLKQAEAVVCYLFPGAMARLDDLLRANLRADSVVITHTFALRGWRPEVTQVEKDLYRTPIYRYKLGDQWGGVQG